MALNNTQSIVIKLLGESSLRDRFYWTGGTLLAEKYLHHRESYDVDLFTDREFRYEEVAKRLSEIRPMLHGSKKEQEALVREIQHYFTDQSARYLHRLLD